MAKSPHSNADISRKVTINFIAALVLFLIVTFIIDGFVLYPIPAPEGYFTASGVTPSFNLYDSEEAYADSVLIDVSQTHPRDFKIYLMEYQDETHLLLYTFHSYTGRGRLAGDLVIDPDAAQTYTVEDLVGSYSIPVADRKISQVEYSGLQSMGIRANPFYLIYLVCALVPTLIVNTIYRKTLKCRSQA